MDIHVKIADKIEVDNFMLQKMTFLYNALENGWNIKKVAEKYIFSKKHEQKKEVYLDSYLREFLESNITNAKSEIMKKSELVDAYRLGNSMFEQTQVDADIIVLRKK